MTKSRAPLGGRIDPSDIKPGTAARRPSKDDQAAQDARAEEAGFTSREGARTPRAKGRAKAKGPLYPEQLNIKVRPEDATTFLDLRDEAGVAGGRLFADMLAAYLERRGG